MRFFSVVTLSLFIFLTLPAQEPENNDYLQRQDRIIRLLDTKDYYPALKAIDSFLRIYPYSPLMYYNRGITRYLLNDIPGSRTDLTIAKALGLKGHDKLIDFICSKDYLANVLAEPYMGRKTKLKAFNNYRPVYTRKDSLRGALRPERTCYDVFFYDLFVHLHPFLKRIQGSNHIYFITVQDARIIQIDLFAGYRIHAITRNGQPLVWRREYDAVFVDLGETLPAGRRECITVVYSGKPRKAPNPPWDGGFVWKRSKGKYWAGVACEHLGASAWWPNKDHLSDKPDSMRITLRVPAGYQAIANGTLQHISKGKRWDDFSWFVHYPINNYNVTFYLGDFVSFSDTIRNSHHTYPVDYYVLPHHLQVAREYYRNTKEMVRIYEELFGEYAYPLDGMGMVEAPFSGMEHQGAIAIGDDYQRSPGKGEDAKEFPYLLVHETAHEWWGNTVTMQDMADAWISEAFATYTESLLEEKKYGHTAYLEKIAGNMQNIRNIWPVVGNRDVNENTFIGNDIYHKGAVMLHLLRCIINNDSIFFGLLKSFYQHNQFKTLVTDDVINFIHQYTGHDYSDFFHKFLYDTDPPILEYSYRYEGDTLIFSYRFTGVGEHFSMPFSITINDEKNFRLTGTTEEQTFVMPGTKKFFLPNEKNFDKNNLTANSFTYYWTRLKNSAGRKTSENER